MHTFLFADLAGFTAMTEVHGDEVAADAVSDFGRGVAELLPEFDAEQIKSIGDAVMVRVPEASAAIDLAVRLIGEVGTRHGSLAVRVGVHTGPAVQRDGAWVGAAVNLAARVAAVAERGEVLMTDATREAAGEALSAYEIEQRPSQTFKNILEPVAVHALTLASQPDVGRPHAGARGGCASSPPARSWALASRQRFGPMKASSAATPSRVAT